MSQPIAETYVEIRPRLSDGFGQDLQRQVQRDVDLATARLKSKIGDDRFARLEKSGVVASFQKTAALQSEIKRTQELEVAQRGVAESNAALGTSFGASVAKIGLYGFAISSLYTGVQDLRKGLQVTGAEAGTTSGRFRNLGASLLGGDVIGAFKALRTEMTLSTQSLADLQHQIAQGDNSKLLEIAKAAEVFGNDAVRKQLTAVSFQTRANLQADRATGASLTPGLRDDLEAARTAEREAQIGLRIFKSGTAEYSKAFAGYAQAVQERRKIQEQIESKSSPLARDAARDASFQLNLIRAEQTKGTANDRAILEGRRDYLRKQISVLEEQGATTTEAKSRLQSLYGKLADADGQITALQKQSLADRQQRLEEQISLQQTQLQIQAANARNEGQEIAALGAQAELARRLSEDKRLDAQARAGYALQAAQADKQIFSINKAAADAARQAAEQAARQREADRKEALAKLKARQEEKVQTRELILENAIAAAGLTKRKTDDRKAIRAQIEYFKDLVANSKGLEREQNRAQLISARARLKGLVDEKAGERGATVAEFFAQAARQFAEFGSNIGGRDAVLSGQDARGRFAGLALERAKPSIGGEIAGAIGRFATPQLSEAQTQTRILRRIESGIRRFGTPDAIIDRETINRARAKAANLGGV